MFTIISTFILMVFIEMVSCINAGGNERILLGFFQTSKISLLETLAESDDLSSDER